jgi:hypothetical protein
MAAGVLLAACVVVVLGSILFDPGAWPCLPHLACCGHIVLMVTLRPTWADTEESVRDAGGDGWCGTRSSNKTGPDRDTVRSSPGMSGRYWAAGNRQTGTRSQQWQEHLARGKTPSGSPPNGDGGQRGRRNTSRQASPMAGGHKKKTCWEFCLPCFCGYPFDEQGTTFCFKCGRPWQFELREPTPKEGDWQRPQRPVMPGMSSMPQASGVRAPTGKWFVTLRDGTTSDVA